jgi:hypothetical protein
MIDITDVEIIEPTVFVRRGTKKNKVSFDGKINTSSD